MRKFIELKNSEARRKIQKAAGVTGMALVFALNYQRNSPSAFLMRKMALENGGKEKVVIDMSEYLRLKAAEKKVEEAAL
jgi:hypothetical protein